MKLNVGLLFAVGSAFAIQSSFSHAAEGELATVRLAHNVLGYSSKTSESKPAGGATSKVETQGLDTFGDNIELAAWVKGYAIYAYPSAGAGNSLWLGKVLNPSSELGVTAYINSSKIKDGNETSGDSLGVYYFWTMPINNDVNFELNLNPSFILGTKKEVTPATGTTAAVVRKTDNSGFNFHLDAAAIVPLAKNFEYAAGLSYDYENSEEKLKSPAPSVKTKVNSSKIGVVLARFRYLI